MALQTFLGLMGTSTNAMSQYWTNESNSQINAANRRWASEEAKAADERQRAQYNDLYSPQAQAEQIRKAGLSLSTLYGQGGMGGTAQGNMANTPNTLPMEAPNFSNLASDILNAELVKAQIDNINADTDNKKSQKPQIQAQTEYTKQLTENAKASIDNIIKDTALKIQQAATEEEKQKLIQSEAELNKAKENYQNWLTKLQEQQHKWNEETWETRKNEIVAHIKEMEAAARKSNAEANSINQMLEKNLQLAELEIAKASFYNENIQPTELERLAQDLVNLTQEGNILQQQSNYANALNELYEKKGYNKIVKRDRFMQYAQPFLNMAGEAAKAIGITKAIAK